jgi:hypothetical protein
MAKSYSMPVVKNKKPPTLKPNIVFIIINLFEFYNILILVCLF